MPENNQTPSNSNKGSKQRLGRGLGSLLGGVPNQGAGFDDASADAVSAANSPTANAVAKLTGTSVEALQAAKTTAVVENKTAVTAAVPSAESGSPAPPAGASQSVSDSNVVAPHATVAKAPVEPAVETSIPETSRIWTIPVEKLVANTQQPRQIFEDSALKELSASIREKGILQPITARRLNEREFEIIAGERRWRAAQLAGLKEVPVILKTVSEQDSLELAILENIQRADLNPMEESEAYENLMKTYGLTQAQVADRLGKERSSVANALRLLALPPEVKLMVGGGELSSGHAKVLLGLESMSDQITLAKEVIREKLSVRALEKKVAEKKSMAAGATAGARAPMGLDVSSKLVEALAGELQKLIGTRVVIDYANRRGKLSVYFHSDEQLTEIVERMRKGWAKPSVNPTASSRV